MTPTKTRAASEHERQRSVVGTPPWMDHGSFDCETGRWRGVPFSMDPDMVMAVTTLMASNDGRANVVRQVRRDNSDARLVIRLVLPG